MADWMEKVSVAALAVGIFQARFLGLFIAALFFAGCMILTKQLELEEEQ